MICKIPLDELKGVFSEEVATAAAGIKAIAKTCVSAPSSSSSAPSSSASAGSVISEVATASGGADLGAGDPTNGHEARI